MASLCDELAIEIAGIKGIKGERRWGSGVAPRQPAAFARPAARGCKLRLLCRARRRGVFRIAQAGRVAFTRAMFHVTILGSGSAGNCALVETAQTRLLIDGGLSARQIGARLAQCGVGPLEIDGILLTHEHGDHAGALRVWGKKYPTPSTATA